jgi:uncharacterized membrane protein YgaE (UPF0421/DUF939 family)
MCLIFYSLLRRYYEHNTEWDKFQFVGNIIYIRVRDVQMKNIPNLITITRILGTTVLLFLFVLNIKFPLLGIYWVIIIAVIRFTSLGVGFMRYKQLTFLHTYANKLTGIALFSSIFMYVALGLYTTTILVCFIASISALEELIINTVSKKLCRDIKSIFLL